MNTALVLLVPAYQPSRCLPEIVSTVTSDGCLDSVVVVDDGSGPEYCDTFQKLGSLPNVTVLRHAINLGVGAALKTGFNHVLVKWPESPGVVTADADGQHAAVDILRVARALAAQPGHMVLGVRDFGPDVPFRSRFGNILTRVIFGLFTGRRIGDTQTGLRGWPRAACMRALRINENGFDFLLECLLRFEAPIVQVPIQTIYLDNNRSSHFNPIRDSMRIYFLFLRYCGSSLLAFVVDSAVFYPVLFSSGNLALSQVAGRAASVCVNFFVVRNLVFQSGGSVIKALAKYLTLVAGSGLIAYTMIAFMHARLGLPIAAAKLAAEGLLFLGNFVIQRDLIFTRKS
ncbi:MAG TPA: bifunctional glycosyltransferase family 2/GtrA family protein [Blastocatellia bacterium]|nr:bifunctional glycosyltransferase family 2/GtrA family protein [Blastocatellia bacterium]